MILPLSQPAVMDVKFTSLKTNIRLILGRSMRTSIVLATLAFMLMMPFVTAKESNASGGTRDGSSVEKAVLVRGGIEPERAWLIKHLGYAPRIMRSSFKPDRRNGGE